MILQDSDKMLVWFYYYLVKLTLWVPVKATKMGKLSTSLKCELERVIRDIKAE